MVTSGGSRHLILVLLSLSVLAPCAGAWSNGGYSANQDDPDYGTHDWIADAAFQLQKRDVGFLTTTYHVKFLLGTEAPDNPEFIGDTANHHVYFYSSRSVQEDDCAVRAALIYETALDYMLVGDYDNAAFDIGVMAHYISDPGVFGHTMGASTDWGTEVHHSDYENAFESMLSSLEEPTGLTLGDSDPYDATMDLARYVTFGAGAIRANTWMDSNYDWSNTAFKASALASLNASVSAVAAVINHLMIEANYTPSEIKTPGPPIAVTAIRDGKHVILSWSPPLSDGGSPVTGYRILRSVSEGIPAIQAWVSDETLSWTDESPVRGTANFYWVVAENSVGSGPISIAAEVFVPKKSSLDLPIALSAAAIALASAGFVIWRRRR